MNLKDPSECSLNEMLARVSIEAAIELFISTLANCSVISKISFDAYFEEAGEFHKDEPLVKKKALLSARAHNKMKEIAHLYEEIGMLEQLIEEKHEPNGNKA